MAALRLTNSKGLVDEDSATRDRVDNRRHQRPMQVTEHDHRAVLAMPQYGSGGFEINDFGRDSRLMTTSLCFCNQRQQCVGVPIDRVHWPSGHQEKQRVASFAAGNIQCPSTLRNQVDVIDQPLSWRVACGV